MQVADIRGLLKNPKLYVFVWIPVTHAKDHAASGTFIETSRSRIRQALRLMPATASVPVKYDAEVPAMYLGTSL